MGSTKSYSPCNMWLCKLYSLVKRLCLKRGMESGAFALAYGWLGSVHDRLSIYSMGLEFGASGLADSDYHK